MKKRTVFLILSLILIMSLSGCGKKKIGDISVKDPGPSEGSSEDDGKGLPNPGKDVVVDITSKKDVEDFIRGEWSVYDTIGGEEYGTLYIGENGESELSIDNKKSSIIGEFDISLHETYDPEKEQLKDDDEYTGFEISFKDIPDEYSLPGDNWEVPDEEGTGGLFYIAADAEYDYLYLKWIGNGDSYIFSHIFQNTERIENEYEEEGTYEIEDACLLRRENFGVREKEALKDEEFYGFAWMGKDGKLSVSEMEPHTYEATDEYTSRRYTEGYFTGAENIGIAAYELSDDADTSLVFHEEKLNADNPLLMFKIKTDSKGKIEKIEEVNTALYWVYDFGNLNQDLAYGGLKFNINEIVFDLTDYDTTANAITDIKQVGDWVVVDAHVNPHVGLYYLVNIYTGNIENRIEGANLTWIGDDLTTAVYSAYNNVYDFKGNIIGQTDGAEVSELSLNNDGSKVRVEDFEGNKYTFNVENGDSAMYRYADFLRKYSPESWKEFMDEIPGDALAYVIECPPTVVQSVLPFAENGDAGGVECVYVVSLKDDTDIHLDFGEYDYEKDDFDTERTEINRNMSKGEAFGYMMVIPEGIPNACLYASCGDKGGKFPISMISGETDLCGTFILPSMSADEAKEKAVISDGSDEGEGYDLFDSYMDIISRYYEAWEGKYDADRVYDMGLQTALTEHGWPWASDADAVRYHFVDIDGDGNNELVITYLGYVMDIWAGNGKEVKLAYTTMYRSESTLRNDGTMETLFSGTVSDGRVTWSRFDPDLAEFMPEYYYTCYKDDNGKKIEEYCVTFYADGGREDAVDFYKENGNIPVWAYENSRELTEKEYKDMCSKAGRLELGEGERIADFTGHW